MNEQIKTWKGQKILSDSDICRNAERGNSASLEKKVVKCLICPQNKAEGFYCSKHEVIIQAIYETWKWDQEQETRKKLTQALKQHLESQPPEHTCQLTHCFELKEVIEKEVKHE